VRNAAIIAFACALFFFCSNAAAQVFYQYPEAPVVPPGQIATGPYVAIGENKLFRGGGFIRMNATKHFDVGFELLADSYDGTGRWGVGADGRLSLPESAFTDGTLLVSRGRSNLDEVEGLGDPAVPGDARLGVDGVPGELADVEGELPLLCRCGDALEETRATERHGELICKELKES